MHESATLSYSIGDIWENHGCIAVDDIDGDVDCILQSGVVDTGEIGEYTLVYYAVDSAGNEAFLEVTKVVLYDASLLSMSLSAYYEDAEGLYGEALLEALRTIINTGVDLQNYDAARDILQIADQDPLNEDNVILIYSGDSVLGTWDEGTTWNREHVWPNSRLGVNSPGGSTRNIATDLHNLRAIDPSVNNSRGNKLFDFETTTSSYYPGEDRGDVARIYFYMMVMWDYLVLRDAHPAVDEETYTIDGAVHGVLSALLVFHYDDPVDAFEINRNEVIYSFQNNRNPFIDYPHLVELLYWDYPTLISYLSG